MFIQLFMSIKLQFSVGPLWKGPQEFSRNFFWSLGVTFRGTSVDYWPVTAK